MGRIVEGEHRYRVVEPPEAAKYDPPLAEYLALPGWVRTALPKFSYLNLDQQP